MRRFLKIVIITLLVLCLYRCVHHTASVSGKDKIVPVTLKSMSTTLSYAGVIQPLKTVIVTSPADGVIANMPFHYGDVVKSGQMIFEVASQKYQADFKAALVQYIKAKTDFTSGQNQLNESDFLHKNKLISDDEYKSKQTSYYNAQLAMIQAKDTLDILLKQENINGVNLYDLKIEDIDKITHVLHVENGAQKISLFSPNAGVILQPNKEGGSDGDIKKIMNGDQVKQGDVLAVIGDLNGLTVRINVSEFNINQLKIGQKVQVTGAAFPDMMLQGEIVGFDHQAQASQGNLPTFPVEVAVSYLTPQQQNIIHIGMSAMVSIEVGGEPELTVPIRAVFNKNDQSYVKVQDAKTGKQTEVAVRTGATTLDSVVIESNLTAGENIVVPD